MAEIISRHGKTNQVKQTKGLVSLNEIIDKLLPNNDTKVKNKLRVKIYSLSRTRNWPWQTIKKRRYYNPDMAQSIILTVKNYANKLATKAVKTQKNASKSKSKKNTFRQSIIKIKKIVEEATQKDKLSNQTKNKLKQRISYIAKINSMKPLNRGKAYDLEDGKQIILELATYYQQLKADLQLAEKIKQTKNDQPYSHSFIKKSTYYLKTDKKDQKNNNLPKNISNLEESYNNLLKNYTDLQLKYETVLNEKNNLINEKANELFNHDRNLKLMLYTIIKKM